MRKFYRSDFGMVSCDLNGHFVRIDELNKMIEKKVIKIDEEKLLQYISNIRMTHSTHCKQVYHDMK